MDYPELEPLGEDMFLNTERRCPVVLLQDTSSSMEPNIAKVNEGLQSLHADLLLDDLASQRVEIAVITFGPVRLVQDFVTVDQWLPPRLHASGGTPMGEAMRFAIQQLRMRKRAYREAGIAYYRPWIWLVTDGAPTDRWHDSLDDVQAEITVGPNSTAPVATDKPDLDVLRRVSHPVHTVMLREAKYWEMFVWLSQSLKPVSRANPHAMLDLPPPTEWGEVHT